MNLHAFEPYMALDRKPPKAGHRFWHCAKCDSIVSYPTSYSKHDVNHLVNKSKFMCLDPMKVSTGDV